jgi:hypothetical protein
MNFNEIFHSTGIGLLNQAEPGGGKTSALVGALNAGYKLRTVSTMANAQYLIANAPPGSDLKIIEGSEEVEANELGHLTTPNGRQPRVWNKVIKMNSGLFFMDKDNVEKMKDWDENTILAFDDVTGLSEDPNAALRLYCMYQKGFLGKEITSINNMRAVGEMAQQLQRVIGAILNLKDRKFHVVVNVHLRRLTQDLNKTMTAAELKKYSSTDADKREKIPMESVTTWKQYPVCAGSTLASTFVRSFPWAVQTICEGLNEPRMYLTPPTAVHDVTIRTPLPVNHPFHSKKTIDNATKKAQYTRTAGVSLPVSTAIPKILELWKEVVETDYGTVNIDTNTKGN